MALTAEHTAEVLTAGSESCDLEGWGPEGSAGPGPSGLGLEDGERAGWLERALRGVCGL